MNTELNLEELAKLFREYGKAKIVDGMDLLDVDFLVPTKIEETIIGFTAGTKGDISEGDTSLKFTYISKERIEFYGEFYSKEGNNLLIFLV